MDTLFLGFCLVAGVSEAGDREIVLRACVEKTIPRKEWKAHVEAEAKRLNLGPKAVAHFSGEWYEKEVEGWIRWQFTNSSYAWKFEEQLWLLTGRGKPPDPGLPLTLKWRVDELARRLPKDMKEWR